MPFVAFSRTGNPAGIKCLIEMDHFDELILDMGCLRCPVIVGGQRRRADQHVTDADLTAAVALPVVSGKTLDQGAAELVLSAIKTFSQGINTSSNTIRASCPPYWRSRHRSRRPPAYGYRRTGGHKCRRCPRHRPGRQKRRRSQHPLWSCCW